MKILIIGGVAAGMSAASKLKRLNPQAHITVFEKGSDVSYGACGMPYHLSGIIEKEHSLIARTAQAFNDQGIEVKLEHTVTLVEPAKKQIRTEHQGIEQTHTYDQLIVASGAGAIRLPVPGKTLENIHVLNSLEDARQLKKALVSAKKIAIIGGGFIGVEVAENLLHMNKDVLLIERLERILPTYDEALSTLAQDALIGAGLTLRLAETVKAYEGDTAVKKVVTDQGDYEVDLVIEAIGVRPNTSFLKDSGLNLLGNGAIVVDTHMRTSDPFIYAAGDCVAYPHKLKKTPSFVPLGTHANKGGRVIAEALMGEETSFQPILGSGIVKVMDLALARTGLTLEEAQSEGYEAAQVEVKARNQAGYYPGAKPIYIHLVYDVKRCVLLGAQMAGEKGVGDRINILALAIQSETLIRDIAFLDMAYSPPFSPVWDPIQVACNQIKCDS